MLAPTRDTCFPCERNYLLTLAALCTTEGRSEKVAQVAVAKRAAVLMGAAPLLY